MNTQEKNYDYDELDYMFKNTITLSNAELIDLRNKYYKLKHDRKDRLKLLLLELRNTFPHVKFKIVEEPYCIQIYCNNLDLHDSDVYISRLCEIAPLYLTDTERCQIAIMRDYFEEIDFEDDL